MRGLSMAIATAALILPIALTWARGGPREMPDSAVAGNPNTPDYVASDAHATADAETPAALSIVSQKPNVASRRLPARTLCPVR